MNSRTYNKLTEEEKLITLELLTEELEAAIALLDEDEYSEQCFRIQINEVEPAFNSLKIEDLRNRYIEQCLKEGKKLEFRNFTAGPLIAIGAAFGPKNLEITYKDVNYIEPKENLFHKLVKFVKKL